jgi:mannitol-1-phosphate/altronate dehydrogenase
MGDKKTFVGFGFGPIQSGLFLYEAYASGNFSRFVVAEIDKSLVAAVRASGGRYTVNVARKGGIDRRELAGIELFDPAEPDGRRAILDAVAASDELATSLPSVRFYDAGGASSVAGLIAEGLAMRKRPRPTILYAAENHNHAAELLREAVLKHAPAAALESVEILNTVIGKMSGVITDAEAIARLNLAPLTPPFEGGPSGQGANRAVLVEEFNRILISRVTLAGYRRGIEVFVEKDDLLPFEEAKLYGHNAVHAMIAYLADLRGLVTIAEAGRDARIMDLARRAFLEESGAALIRRHARLNDPLFTEPGYRDYADDLLARMVNPNLNDLVARVGRDHARKLAYDDRLYGTMRLALQYSIEPKLLALGAAAGVLSMIKRQGELRPPLPTLPRIAAELTEDSLRSLLLSLWGEKADEYAPRLIDLTWEAFRGVR